MGLHTYYYNVYFHSLHSYLARLCHCFMSWTDSVWNPAFEIWYIVRLGQEKNYILLKRKKCIENGKFPSIPQSFSYLPISPVLQLCATLLHKYCVCVCIYCVVIVPQMLSQDWLEYGKKYRCYLRCFCRLYEDTHNVQGPMYSSHTPFVYKLYDHLVFGVE